MRHDRLMARRVMGVMLVGLLGPMLMSLPGSGVDAQSPAEGLPEQRFEIIMKNFN